MATREEVTVHRRGGKDSTTFTLRLPRWPLLLGLRGRDPLVRTADRVEAMVLAVAIVVSLVTLPVAGAVGTALYDAKQARYSEQAAASTPVTATITAVPPASDGPHAATIAVPARWSVDGTEHTGLISATSSSDVGDPVDIWVDDHGTQVTAPVTTTRAAAEAVTAAILIWLAVSGAAAALYGVTRVMADRHRAARWQRGLERLIEQSDGQGRSRAQ
ncbi:Rv1733c family protein [Mycolicibacterium pulveris]|uniref:Rv1733c family protein n=1 Tax=Mycolicibacterium pulveris TaxID=36813 RepID=UPI003CF03296